MFAQFGGWIIGLAALLVLGSLFGAAILRAAICLYNKLAGSNAQNGVPEPSFSAAMGMTFATMLVGMAVVFVMGFTVNAGDAPAGSDPTALQGLALFMITLPIGLLVNTGMLSALLPTSFGRAWLVTLCNMIVAALVAVGLAVVVIIFGLVLNVMIA